MVEKTQKKWCKNWKEIEKQAKKKLNEMEKTVNNEKLTEKSGRNSRES